MKYHTVRHTENETLMLCALRDFSAQLGRADVIPYLISCSEDYETLIRENRAELEACFVIADSESKGELS